MKASETVMVGKYPLLDLLICEFRLTVLAARIHSWRFDA